jgi:hypothetical protein
LTRQWGYGFSTVQGTPPAGGGSATLLGNADCTRGPCVTCAVDYTPDVLLRNGLLYLRLTVSDPTGEQIDIFRQVHVDNSP